MLSPIQPPTSRNPSIVNGWNQTWQPEFRFSMLPLWSSHFHGKNGDGLRGVRYKVFCCACSVCSLPVQDWPTAHGRCDCRLVTEAGWTLCFTPQWQWDSVTPTLAGSICNQSSAKWKHFHRGAAWPPLYSSPPLPRHTSSSLSAPPPPRFFLLFFFFRPASLSCSPALQAPVNTLFLVQRRTHTQWTNGEEGRGFRENKLPFLTFSTTPPRHCPEGGIGGKGKGKGGGDRKGRGRQDGDARQGQALTTGFIVEVQGFNYQSVGPLRKTRQR